jgi:hypothetical protein
MGPLFTQYVRSLEGTLDERLALAAWQRLREILKSELKRRGLWSSPPSYLGIFGWPAWNEAGAGALDELTAECYSFIFVDRLGRLQAQLRLKPNIEGLVLLNVHHFFLERQKENDPLGYRVFEMAQAAVRQAIEHGELFVLAGDPQVRNSTVLGFAPGAPEETEPSTLGPLVARWNDELLPDLVLARGQRQEEVWRKLRALLRDLAPRGIGSFRFRDILDPLKSDTRRRWGALLAAGDEGGPPEAPVVAQESLEKLTRYMSAAVSQVPEDSRTREDLATLWRYLKAQAGSGEPGDAGETERLSHRRLAQVLGISRERLPGLFAKLRRLAAQAQLLARHGRKGHPGSTKEAG